MRLQVARLSDDQDAKMESKVDTVGSNVVAGNAGVGNNNVQSTTPGAGRAL